jgi:PAH dioxygenase small subunit
VSTEISPAPVGDVPVASAEPLTSEVAPRPKPVPVELRLAVHDFMDEEAELLDERRFEEWLALFTDDLVYQAPVRITAKRGHREVIDEISHFDETKMSLGLRVRRLGTDVAWAEDPPSVTRRFVTNVKVGLGESSNEITVRTYLLLYRTRGDRGTHDLLSCVRHDVLRVVPDSFRIARRRVVLDQAVLGTKNLAVFL